MTSATANITLNYVSGREKLSIPVKSGETIWKNGYTALAQGAHASAGYATEMLDDTNSIIPVGFADQKVVGDGALRASISAGGGVVRRMTITDIAGTIADVGLLVYITDDQTFTLTRPTTVGCPVGITVGFNAVNDFDVYFFSFGELAMLALSGWGRRTWCIGAYSPEGSSGNALTGIVLPCHGKIIDFYAICAAPIADADADYDLNLEIGGTNVTGGVVEIVTADTLGLKKSGTAITAANEFHEGDLLDVEQVANAAGTTNDGMYNLYLDVQLMPGV